ncbi:MAG: TrmH family RNA methyltransferase, partial [candidate division WOR-3 bacterium]
RGGLLIEELDVKSEKLAIIVGSEHYGIRKKLIEMSDKIITLRQYNFKVNSYNVSNAVAIALYILTLKFQIK